MGRNKRNRAAAIFLGVFALMAACAVILLSRTLHKIARVETPTDIVTVEEESFEADEGAGEDTLDPKHMVWTTPEPQQKSPKITNILLIGQDRRGTKGRGNSDSMIICSVNEDTNEITLVSLMRDMYVPFPGEYSDNRINAAYPFGGFPLLDQLIEEDFGVHIDGNIEVDFRSFIKVMDLIAPLDVELKRYEVGYMNSGKDWYLHEGVNSLNGEQLLRYARMRHVGHADWERTERQRYVLRLAYEKVKDWKLTKLLELMDTVLPCLTTDMSDKEILDLLSVVAFHRMRIGAAYRLPVEGTYTSEVIRQMAVLVPDLGENGRMLQEYLYGSWYQRTAQ